MPVSLKCKRHCSYRYRMNFRRLEHRNLIQVTLVRMPVLKQPALDVTNLESSTGELPDQCFL